VEQGIVPLGNSLFRPVPPGLLEDELLDAAELDDDDDAAAAAAAAGVVLEGGGGGGAEVEVDALELVVGCWKNSAASEEEEEGEDELVLVEDADEVVLSGTSI
jgi:hypothetical protein